MSTCPGAWAELALAVALSACTFERPSLDDYPDCHPEHGCPEGCVCFLGEACVPQAGQDDLGPDGCDPCLRWCRVANGEPDCTRPFCTILACDDGYEDCDGDFANGCEADLALDPRNCGECGVICSVGLECVEAECLFACDEDLTRCGDACVDVLVDPDHCGGCHRPCLPLHAGARCDDGLCTYTACEQSWADCNGSEPDGCETNLRSDPDNCGECHRACEENEFCQLGICVLACTQGWTQCLQGCVDVQTDPGNCGGCGITCGQDQVCNTGSCASGCSGGRDRCGQACVDLDTDPAHCGNCDNICQVAHGLPACSGGVCDILWCTSPWDDCDGDPDTICETNTDSDPVNCGVCHNHCAMQVPCWGGQCGEANAVLCADGVYCSLDTEICCWLAESVSCVPEIDGCDFGQYQMCDGVEDCHAGGGLYCCQEAVGTAPACRMSCPPDRIVCNSDTYCQQFDGYEQCCLSSNPDGNRIYLCSEVACH